MTPIGLPEIEPWLLAARLANDAVVGTWVVLCAPAGDVNRVADDMLEQMRSLFDDPVQLVRVATTADVRDAVSSHNHAALVLVGLDRWQKQRWERLDTMRSRLARHRPTLIVLDDESAAKLVAHAPNLWSWVAGSGWTIAHRKEAAD